MDLHNLGNTSSVPDPTVAEDFSPIFRVFKDGTLDRQYASDVVPPHDPKSIVLSKDVLYSSELNLSSRLYLPKTTTPGQKLPLLVYFHGGGFVAGSGTSSTYHNYLNTLVAEANIVAVSVDYRLAPEHPLPCGYEDCWTALKWVASHVNEGGSDGWLKAHADFDKVFFAGDSAGANITYHMAIRYDQETLAYGFNLAGILLIQPYFWGMEPIGNEPKEPSLRAKVEAFWKWACPTSSGVDDPLFNPRKDPKLATLGCNKVFVLVAEKDLLRDRGLYFCEILGKSGWQGEVDTWEANGENHVFQLLIPNCETAGLMLKKIASFLNQEKA